MACFKVSFCFVLDYLQMEALLPSALTTACTMARFSAGCGTILRNGYKHVHESNEKGDATKVKVGAYLNLKRKC